MSEEHAQDEQEQLSLGGVGQRLRDAREQAGLGLEEVAAETRIPTRHLVHIENGDFGSLPARTYAVGFSRSYARMVGLDEKEIAAQVREELNASGNTRYERPDRMEPGDPARIPSRGLVWFAALAVILLVAGGLAFFGSHFAPGAGPGPLISEQSAQLAEAEATGEPQAASVVADPSGEVVFTSLEDGIWVKFYDGSGKRLFEKQMAKGESYAVPKEVEKPQIWTGRPDAFAITIGGNAVPQLSEEETVLRDVAIDAASLLARADEVEANPAVQSATVDNSAT